MSAYCVTSAASVTVAGTVAAGAVAGATAGAAGGAVISGVGLEAGGLLLLRALRRLMNKTTATMTTHTTTAATATAGSTITSRRCQPGLVSRAEAPATVETSAAVVDECTPGTVLEC